MARLGCISSPGVKHNPYATISVNRTTVCDNGGILSPGGSSFQYNVSRGEYYTDQFTLTVNARANGEDLYYEITGAAAVEARFYQSGRSAGYLPTNYNIHPDGSTATTTGNILVGRIGRSNSATWTKCVFANTTTSNTTDSTATTTFSVNLRSRNGSTGTILSTTSTITCYIFRFVLDIYNESTSLYQTASYTIPGEFTTAGTTSRNYYFRLQLPSATVYNNQSIYGSFNGSLATFAPTSGTAVTIGSDMGSSMSWQGVWNDGPTYNYHWFGGGIYKDNLTEPIEYFRMGIYWTSPTGVSPGVPWSYSNNHAIAANTS